jgi:hypothetical protein
MHQALPLIEQTPEVDAGGKRIGSLQRSVAAARHRRVEQLAEAAEIEQARDGQHVTLGQGTGFGPGLEAKLPEQALPHRGRHPPLHLDPHHRVRRPPAHRFLDGLEQIARPVLDQLEVGRAGEAEEVRFHHLPAGVEGPDVRPNDLLQRDEVRPAGDRQEPRQSLGKLDDREVHRPVLAVPKQHRQQEHQSGQHLHREARRHGNGARGKGRKNLPPEPLRQQGALGRRHVVPRADPNPLGGQAGQALVRLAILPLHQLHHADGERLEPSGVHLGAAPLEGTDVHHVELVEVGAHDGEEAEPLEQRRGLVLRQRQHASVELQHAGVLVQQRLGVGHGVGRRQRRVARAGRSRNASLAEEVGAGGQRQRHHGFRVVEPRRPRPAQGIDHRDPHDAVSRTVLAQAPRQPDLL